MFARKATFRAVDRVRIAQVRPVHSNDNHGHRIAAAPRAPALVCHWHIDPATGKPECRWDVSPSCRRDPVANENRDSPALIRLDEVRPCRRGKIS
jgi:hypothetical protein